MKNLLSTYFGLVNLRAALLGLDHELLAVGLGPVASEKTSGLLKLTFRRFHLRQLSWVVAERVSLISDNLGSNLVGRRKNTKPIAKKGETLE